MATPSLRQTATQVRQSLASLGVHLRQDWILHCLGGSNGAGGPQSTQEEIYRIFLACDLREAGEACLPAGVGDMVKSRVEGKMVVQVENSRDISKNFEQREKAESGSSYHTLKLALGDGRQTVAAFEYHRIQGLSADPPPGLKLLLVEPWVHRGILLLSSDNTTVLGGQVSSLVEARDSARAGGPNTNTASATSSGGSNSQTQPAHTPAAETNRPTPPNGIGGEGQAARSGARQTRPRQPAERTSRQPDNPGSGSVEPRSASVRRGRREDDYDDEDGAEPPSGGQRRSSGAVGSRAQASASGVFNPYAGVTQPAPASGGGGGGNGGGGRREGRGGGRGAAVAAAATSRSESREPDTARRSKASDRRARGREAKVPAFLDSGDDGPGFEYLEEPDFEDDSTDAGEGCQQPPDEPARGGGGVGTQGTRSDRPLPASARLLSPPDMSPPPPPPVTPRPKIVTAREQQQREKLREDARRRSREGRGGSGSGGGGGYDGCEVADIEGDFGGGIGGSGSGWKGKKRGRSKIGSPGSELERDSRPSPPPRGPYTPLADLEGSSVTGGVHRVKAVVSDTMGCKLRKKKYLLVIEIEDGTAILRVRLSEPITRRLFGVDAREFKKIFQADSDRAIGIQARVEREIREMEGVMEIDVTPATAATQSPAAPETPGTAMSQGSTTSDSEWLLPVVVSVSPPTDDDCRRLLARVRTLL